MSGGGPFCPFVSVFEEPLVMFVWCGVRIVYNSLSNNTDLCGLLTLLTMVMVGVFCVIVLVFAKHGYMSVIV